MNLSEIFIRRPIATSLLMLGIALFGVVSYRVLSFRPIMMTTSAALLGAIPISLGYGSGGEVRRPQGLTVVGGLLFSQLITLYLTPVIYTYMASLMILWRHRRNVPAYPVMPAPQGALTGTR